MSSIAEQVKQALMEAVGTPVQVLPATVASVDKDKGLCKVVINGTLEKEDVRLRAVEGADGFLVIPKKDSHVLVARLANSDEMYVAMFSEVDKVIIKNTQASLKALLDQFIDELVKMQVLTPVGPGTLSPANIAVLQQVKTKVGLLFE